MRTRTFILVLIAFLSFSLKAYSGSISGYIISDADEQLIPHVGVTLNKHIGTYSDNQGYFHITDLAIGSYTVFIQSLGYQNLLLSVDITANDPNVQLGKIKLIEKPIQIIDINITHIPKFYDDKYSGSTQIIRKEDLIKIQPIGTEEILRQVPGVNISGDMGISNRLNAGIRGSYPRRSDKLLLLEDGTPIAPATYLAPSAYYNPPTERLDGIEVIKGPGLMALGPHSMFGAINYITHKPPLTPTLEVRTSGGMRNYLSQMMSYGGTWKNIGAQVQVLNKQFDGFQDNTRSHIFNTTAKIFADLGRSQSLYAKVNFHNERSKATYSGQTPLTFNLDPTQNPFDADDLFTTRYAADIIHQASLAEHFTLSSKVYVSSFTRDWWRQNTTVLKAKDARSYLGDRNFLDRYGYLDGQIFTDEDYVRVGKLSNGFESTKARNRKFKIIGLQEKLEYEWKIKDVESHLEFVLTNHTEKFDNVEIINDSARFARRGEKVNNEKFSLNASSAYVKNSFEFNRILISSMFKYEVVKFRRDVLPAIQQKPNDPPPEIFTTINFYGSFQPGVELTIKLVEKKKNSLHFYSSAYKGYTPPTTGFAFLAVEEDKVSSPGGSDTVNMLPEYSLNLESGLRGSLPNNSVQGQISFFNNTIRNFYAAGRKEAFESLGSININGAELGISLDLSHLISSPKHLLKISSFSTIMQSRILQGMIIDKDIFKAKHSNATADELVSKVNTQRHAYTIYFENDSLINRNITRDDFDKIESMEINFGQGMLENNLVPYVPNQIHNFMISYGYMGFAISAQYSKISDQFTSYLNINNESADGALGKLKGYETIDLNGSFTFPMAKNKNINEIRVYVAVKNITNEIYRASRLHRVSSGIIPGGFRQINAGVHFKF